ncbi:hypothetical protein [Streptomyces sp. NBC_00623]|uniref:hypothetical protein n=1 Tax=Streptomyces sp. NBC_00623 TaxID=2975790 RepID=UPI0030DF7274
MANLRIPPPAHFLFPEMTRMTADTVRESPQIHAAVPTHRVSIRPSLRTPDASPPTAQRTCHERRLLRELAGLLGTQPEDAPAVLRTRLALLADAQAEVERLLRAELVSAARALAERAHVVPGGLLVATRVDNTTGRKLRQLASAVAGHLSSGMGLVVLCTPHEGRALLVCAVGHRLRAQGVDAREVLWEAAAAIGGIPAGRGARSSAAGQWTDELGRALSLARARASALLRRSVG